MKRLLLIALLLVVGCAPLDLYNAKIDRINQYQQTIDARQELSKNQKLLLQWEKTKEEFPEYAGYAENIIAKIKKMIELQERPGKFNSECTAWDPDAYEKMTQEQKNGYYQQWTELCFIGVKGSAEKYIEEYNRLSNDFWQRASQDIHARQAQWSQGMMNAATIYNNQLYQQQQYYNNLNQQRRSTNCTTFFNANNTANTSCY